MFSKLFGSEGSVSSLQRQMADRSPRVRILSLHNLEFEPTGAVATAPMLVENISATGLGLRVGPGFHFTNQQTVEGSIKIEDSKYLLQLRIVWVHEDRLGAVIENPSPDFMRSLRQYFEAELAAIQLRPVHERMLNPVPNGQPHWFQGSNNCDLSYVTRDGEVVDFTISVFGNHIEWSKDKPLRFSQVSESEKRSAYSKGATLLQESSQSKESLIELSTRMLNAVEGLNVEHRNSILRSLKQNAE